MKRARLDQVLPALLAVTGHGVLLVATVKVSQLPPISTQYRAQSAWHCEYNTRRSHIAANRIAMLTGLRGGGNMDKRKTWREQEQRLVEGWNAATERLREAQAEVERQSLTQGGGAPTEECVRTAEVARAELEAMRRQVARMKVEFSTGKRY
jgi:hypothetical protein